MGSTELLYIVQVVCIFAFMQVVNYLRDKHRIREALVLGVGGDIIFSSILYFSSRDIVWSLIIFVFLFLIQGNVGLIRKLRAKNHE